MYNKTLKIKEYNFNFCINRKRPQPILLGILHKRTMKDNYPKVEHLFTNTFMYPLTVKIKFQLKAEFKHKWIMGVTQEKCNNNNPTTEFDVKNESKNP